MLLQGTYSSHGVELVMISFTDQKMIGTKITVRSSKSTNGDCLFNLFKNPAYLAMMWPFKWKLSACTYTWCYLFFKILQKEIWKSVWNLPLATFGSELLKKLLVKAWQNSTTPAIASPRNNVWETTAEIAYWWLVTTQISLWKQSSLLAPRRLGRFARKGVCA